jgi:transposase
MQKPQIRIEFRHVDLSGLETEDDFRREAKRLLPEALVQLGEAIGEETWNTLQKGLRGSKFKVNTSSSEKQKFVKEAGKNYKTKASAKDRKEIENYIVQQLQLRKHQ